VQTKPSVKKFSKININVYMEYLTILIPLNKCHVLNDQKYPKVPKYV